MKLSQLWLALGLAGLGVSQQVTAARAVNLISNPSFETPTVPAGQYTHYTTGSIIGGAWTVLGTDVNVISSTFSEPSTGVTVYNAEDGLNSLSVGGNVGISPPGSFNGVQQTVNTTPNTSYNLTFFVGSASGIYTPATVNLSLNSGSFIPFTNNNVTPNGINWKQFSYSFTPTNTSTTIAFLSTDTTAQLLDNVSLTATTVPEPSEILGTLFFSAIGAGYLLKRQRRNNLA